MDEVINFKITVPTDNEGFILLKCRHCGSYFKCMPDDIESDEILHIFCPSCGLISECYLTPEVIELAEKMTRNIAMDMTYEAVKALERETKGKPLSIKAGKRPKHEIVDPIRTGIEAMDIIEFDCCHRKAKVKPLLKMTGCYCPFCGVKYELK